MASDNIKPDDRNIFNKVAYVMETYKGGVQYGAYSIALVGLAVVLRSVRPFKRFTLPAQIPASFIEQQMRLSGRVLRIEPSSGVGPTTLIVNHFPVISVRRYTTDELSVQIASVDLSSNGISWLQHVVVGKDVDFTLLKCDAHSVSCIVSHQKRNIGVDLVTLGFASVSAIEFSLQKNARYLTYYKTLLAAETRAEKRGLGMWHGEASLGYQILHRASKPIKAVLSKLQDQFVRRKSLQVAT